jgi:hypothetical protein
LVADPVVTLNGRVDDLNQNVEKLSSQQEEIQKQVAAILEKLSKPEPKKMATVKKDAKPVIVVDKPELKLKAITRTPHCESCKPFALVETKKGVAQVGTGDSVSGYAVTVDDDRVLLTKGKTQHSYYLSNEF